MNRSSRGIALLSMLGVLLVVVLLLAAAFLWFARQDAAGRAEVAESLVELQVASQRLPRLATEAVAGSREAFDILRRDADGVAVAAGPFGGAVADTGRQLADAAGRVADQSEQVLIAQSAGDALRQVAPSLAASVEALAGDPAAQAAARAAAESVAAAEAFLAGLGDPEAVLRRLDAAEALMSQVVLGLLGRDATLGLAPLSPAGRADALAALEQEHGRYRGQVMALVAASDGMVAARLAAADARRAGDRLMNATEGGMPAPGTLGPLALDDLRLPLLLALAALVLAVVLLVSHMRGEDTRRLAERNARQNERNQQAILRLLDELGSLADGDLTVQATVTEDITGAIADSINYAIEALRELVTTINETSIKVDGAAKQTQATASHLASASETQSKQVADATESIARMAASIEAVSGDAERGADVARHSVDVAHKGGEAVRRTIEGMNTIRETIQDTSKRIKRLGESSQEIGNIVELINDIAEQTNILALNASIQASMAGESGRGFAVVADEVQRLAERAANATRQIEVLVNTIQSDTNEAVISMERSTTDVVGGALLAENAGAALDEIESVSNQIAGLVQNISRTAKDQATAAADITRNMNVLREVSAQTAEATGATSASIGKLAELATQLRGSAAGFRLPEAADGTGRGSDRT
ncbi:MAG: methyl-accepting chemotaxis protein [Gammaproteobacteria bacterium]